MKKLSYLIVLALILGLTLAGCTLLSNIGQAPTSEQSGIAYLTKGPGSLVGLWHFDEGSGTTANDSSGNFNDGTLMGNTSWTSGKFDNALSFDGDGDYVQLPASNTILNTDTFTIEAWFKTSVNHPAYGGTEGRLVNLHRMGTASTAVSLYVEQDQIGLLYYTGTAHVYMKYTVNYHDDVWHHIAVTHDATTYRLYYDGVEVASQDDAFGDFGTYPAYLGTYNGSERFFNGLIDEVRIWDEALSGDDIEESYSLGAIEFTKELTEVLPDPVGWVGDMPQVSIDTSVTFTMPITVNNQSLLNLNDAWVKDRLGAELEVVPYGEEDPFDETIGEATYYTKGKSEKVFIDWYLDIGAGSTETLTIVAKTDINPGGGNKIHQEYTSPDVYELNSGATLTFYVTVAGEDISLVVTTDGLWVEAVGEEDEEDD